jgi:translation initiation factor 2B subunit (eIF-2B alpha/beta/delta family)
VAILAARVSLDVWRRREQGDHGPEELLELTEECLESGTSDRRERLIEAASDYEDATLDYSPPSASAVAAVRAVALGLAHQDRTYAAEATVHAVFALADDSLMAVEAVLTDETPELEESFAVARLKAHDLRARLVSDVTARALNERPSLERSTGAVCQGLPRPHGQS